MSPPTDVPTWTQLGLHKWTLVIRGLGMRCPVCGTRGLFHRWFTMVERCPNCDLAFNRTEGHVIGYIGLNTMVCFTATFFVLLGGSIIMIPHISVLPLLVGVAITAGVLPIAFAPAAKTLWTALDLMMRPLQPDEVDPRFVTPRA